MKDISEFGERMEPALRGLLGRWRIWAGDDVIRALHIGFDASNAEIAISLLTDREPYLEERRLSPFGMRWPVADWRLYGLNATFRYRFPDVEDVLDWMRLQSELLDTEAVTALNERLKAILFEVVTGPGIREELRRFRHLDSSFKVRVEWFFDDSPLDAQFAVGE
jgi:hypothetical protein